MGGRRYHIIEHDRIYKKVRVQLSWPICTIHTNEQTLSRMGKRALLEIVARGSKGMGDTRRDGKEKKYIYIYIKFQITIKIPLYMSSPIHQLCYPELRGGGKNTL